MDLVILKHQEGLGFCMKKLELDFLDLAEKNQTTHIAWMTNMHVSEIYIFV